MYLFYMMSLILNIYNFENREPFHLRKSQLTGPEHRNQSAEMIWVQLRWNINRVPKTKAIKWHECWKNKDWLNLFCVLILQKIIIVIMTLRCQMHKKGHKILQNPTDRQTDGQTDEKKPQSTSNTILTYLYIKYI